MYSDLNSVSVLLYFAGKPRPSSYSSHVIYATGVQPDQLQAQKSESSQPEAAKSASIQSKASVSDDSQSKTFSQAQLTTDVGNFDSKVS